MTLEERILDALQDGPWFKADLLDELDVTEAEFAAAWRELDGRGLVKVGLEYTPGKGRPLMSTAVAVR